MSVFVFHCYLPNFNFVQPSHLSFELAATVALKYLGISERTNQKLSAIMAAISAACFVLIGLATLYLEVASITDSIGLYLFLNNVSLGMYNRSN